MPPATPTIRTYQDQDESHVIALWQTVFNYPAAHNDPALTIRKKLEVADGLFFVATLGEKVIGTIMAGYDGHRGWLYLLAVDDTHRSNGLGSQLIEHAEQALAARGCMKVNLQLVGSNAETTAFYEKLGYTVEDRISMGKIITSNITPSHLT
jgi:ribosomal protein S18 acetylase RimI-like enzyme